MGPRVALVGRPNTGKSTLFNRLVGRRLALVDDLPGVTRDRRLGMASLADLSFQVVDTAGLDEPGSDDLLRRIQEQTQKAIAEADILLFLLDARAGILPMDHHYAAFLRQSNKPLILLLNKAEGRFETSSFYEAYGLGFGPPLPISAAHGEGLDALYTALQNYSSAEEKESVFEEEASEVFQSSPSSEKQEGPLFLAITGRPNTGKSSLINAFLGEERLLTGPQAGMTRDSISVDWNWKGQAIRLFDTAGLRRRARVQEKLEKLSVADALRAIQFAQVLVILMDATQAFEKQDLQIIQHVVQEGRALVLGLSKWDLVQNQAEFLKALERQAARLLDAIPGVRLIPISALTGQGKGALMEAVFEVYSLWNTRLSTGPLNRWLAEIVHRHPPPAVQGRPLRLRYITQAKTRPPHFIVFCTRPEKVPASYQRYLTNALRAHFGLAGIPLRLSLRKGENPYAAEKKPRRARS